MLFRDGHKCCVKSCKENILNVHHIESRKVGGNAPNNLITICEKHHKQFHEGKVKINIKRGKSFKDATFMGVMRWTFYNRLKEQYPNVKMTYGYITKNTRIENNLPKDHNIDAYCIANNISAKRLDYHYYFKKVRCHNRQIHKAKTLKGGRRKLNQAQYLVKGFRLFDKVKYEDKLYYIFGRRNSGFFDIRNLKGEKVNKGSISCKKLKLIESRKSILCERIVNLG